MNENQELLINRSIKIYLDSGTPQIFYKIFNHSTPTYKNIPLEAIDKAIELLKALKGEQ